MSKRPPKSKRGPEVVRRPSSERKRLPADLEAFAGGDDDALWRRPAKRRLDDPRPVVLVPGVANRDARAVYEARERRIRAALERGDREAAAVELAEAARLRLWRAHSVVGWDVLVEHVLGLAPEEAAALRGGRGPDRQRRAGLGRRGRRLDARGGGAARGPAPRPRRTCAGARARSGSSSRCRSRTQRPRWPRADGARRRWRASRPSSPRRWSTAPRASRASAGSSAIPARIGEGPSEGASTTAQPPTRCRPWRALWLFGSMESARLKDSRARLRSPEAR
ncbi:MAG: hypothetical protein M5U28_34270 [Sandaracinaceae bacterium]|nr:hypothetical protein [Sandaracinaceae bacterium]